MTSEEFKFWLNGYFSLTDDEYVDVRQLDVIRNHANLVKAVSGILDESINVFIKELEKLTLKHTSVPINSIKQKALSNNLIKIPE